MSDFLLEIGLEEVPARMIAAAQAELGRRTVALLQRERLVATGSQAETYSTPRRLAVLVAGVADHQPDLTEDILGPATRIAYKDGVATPAAHAFAKKAGVPVEQLRTVATPKGDYLAATTTQSGRSAAEVLTSELPKELAALYWPKSMYWRRGKPERFVRPLRWLLALLGDDIVPIEFAGHTASRQTYGHRILFGSAPFPIAQPSAYLTALSQASVIADVELRRHTIRKALDRACRQIPGSRWREDHALVDKLTHLTEFPSVIAGSFDPEYLSLPQEVLVTVMRDHQNYFAVEDTSGNLAPHFLAVLNTAASDAGEQIIRHGNERVLRARFNDARFFWQFDQRIPLIDRVALLENVTFQKDLGSYAKKSERVRRIAAALATHVPLARAEDLDTAAQLAKTDLTSELVKEFTELQGQIGGLYARHQGLAAAAADAIYDHYRPTSMEDRIPRTVEGQLLALADKADTIAGMFSLGLEPTGSKDPFALRRAANGIIKILAESDLPLTLSQVAQSAAPESPLNGNLRAFLNERLDFYLREARGQAYDVVKAVLALPSDNVRDAVARAEAVTCVRSSADFAAVSAAFKRMQNILSQAAGKGSMVSSIVDPAALTHPAERTLDLESQLIAARVLSLRAAGNYVAALESIATLRPQVDSFFDAVMVLDPDPRIRANRLALLTRILQDFTVIADFSEIVTAG